MGAPAGNKFWELRSKHGREKLFATPDLLWQAALDYFEWCCDNPIEAEDNKGTKNVNIVKFLRPLTLKGFCIYCDASEHWFMEFEKAQVKEGREDFLSIIRKIRDIIYTQKLEGAIIGLYNANIVARELGLQEKTDSVVRVMTVEPKEWTGADQDK